MITVMKYPHIVCNFEFMKHLYSSHLQGFLNHLIQNVAPMFIHCFVLHFVIKMEILPIIIDFLLQIKYKAVDKTLEQNLLTEFKATCKTLVNLSLKITKSDLK